MLRPLLFVLLTTWLSVSWSQVIDDFSDGNLDSNPTWQGDVSTFKVNDDFQLQLNDTDAGSSLIYVPYEGFDSMVWKINFLMDFSPSASNRLEIYLALSDPDASIADGYYLSVGENGSDDALHFYRLDGGTPMMIATGSLGALSGDPAEANVEVIRDGDDVWTINVDYSGGGLLVTDMQFSDSTYPSAGSHYFGVSCTYTSTRADKFYFDDIIVDRSKPDTTPPVVQSITLIDDQTVEVIFSEIVTMASAENLSNYVVDNGIGSASEVIFIGPNQVEVTFVTPLSSGIDYTLSIFGIEDEAGNISSTSMHPLFILAQAQAGDLIVNEILFDPLPNGSDFIEILNVSDKFLMLDDVYVANLAKGELEKIVDGVLLEPGQHLALSDDINFIEENYNTSLSEVLVEQDIPSFNNSDGNISILINGSQGMVTIDSFDYTEDMHFTLLDDTEGVSLERISATSLTTDPNNWHSAAQSAGWATPGYENSNVSNGMVAEGMFELENKTFSPDGDSFEDLMILNYDIGSTGFLANVNIYDSRGRLERNLLRNELLGSEGFVKWDGINNDGDIAPMGIYIIWIELFHSDGTVTHKKLTTVLAEKLN